MRELFDTIAAVATPTGAGGIGVIRVSGEDAFDIADAMFRTRSGEKLRELKGYTARLGDVVDINGEVIDEAVALVFKAGRSYTGEDEVEIMCHGGETVCASVLRETLLRGAVPAPKGEYTRRAFMNGRISLDEAEAACDIINASSELGQRTAVALAKGALRKKADEIKAIILEIQAHITAYIDFPEEDVDEIDRDRLDFLLRKTESELSCLLSGYDAGSAAVRGISTVIAGSPNVGKSTLMNLLSRTDAAIVTEIAGTTRDVVERRVQLGGLSLILADTAGIRDSEDAVERIGVSRSLSKIEEAGLVLAVFDSSRSLGEEDKGLIERLKGRRAIAVINKTDLPTELETAEVEKAFTKTVYISAKDDSSRSLLAEAVREAVGVRSLDENAAVIVNERQRDCVDRALRAASDAFHASENTTLDVVYALLREAHAALSELSGEDASEAVIDEVFSKFCVGK